MAEYKLSFTAADINSKLGKIDGLSVDVESLKNDINNSDLSGLNSTVNNLNTAMQSTVKTQIQNLTNEQKTQARDNIDAVGNEYVIEQFTAVQNNIDSLERSVCSLETTHANDKAVLQNSVDGKVPLTRTVNGKPLSSDVVLSASDVGAIPSTEKSVANGIATLDENGKLVQMPSAADVRAVNKTGDTMTGNLIINTTEDTGHTMLIDANTFAIFAKVFGQNHAQIIPNASDNTFWANYSTDGGRTFSTNKLLHTGNKPHADKAFYYGNATAREVQIGGLGFVCAIRGNNHFGIVWPDGGMFVKNDDIGIITQKKNEGYFENGKLVLAADNTILNPSGGSIKFDCQVL